MNSNPHSPIFLLALLTLLMPVFAFGSDPQPRRGLWASHERIDQIREALTVPNSHHQRAFAVMKSYVDTNHEYVITVPDRLGSAWNIERSYLAQQAALTALLSATPADRQHYAQIAYDALWAMYADPDSGGHTMLGSAQHLSKATIAISFATAYEFAYDLWTQAQRDWVLFKMDEALNGWVSLSHINFGNQFSSNWLPVVRGAEMSMMLSAGQESERPLRYRQLRSWLLSNANTHGPRGWGQEGNYYMAYGQIFAWPAKIAAANAGDPEMKMALSTSQHHLIALYASAISENFDVVNWGVGGSIWDGGFMSLAMAMAPAGEKPYFRWFYDRFLGVQSLAPESLRYDRDRQGRMWSILFYPENLPAKDPTQHFPLAIEDTGGFFIRSGWTDENDVVAFLGTDRAFYSPGWDAPDALSLVVLANGRRYINGPGNTAHQASAKDLFSTILVNDAVPSTGRTGGREWFGLADNGAYAIATGGAQYSNLGVGTAHRHLLADFSEASGSRALLGLRDKLRSSAGAHQYRWQINTGTGNVVLSQHDGRQVFTITYPGSDGYLRGWVVHPASAQLQTATGRLFFNTTAVDADIWVVMAVGTGPAPTAQISGSGLGSLFQLNGVQMSYDTVADRMLSSAVTFANPPSASFTVSPTSGPANLTVNVNAGASTGASGIVEYVWDFGDGTTATGVTASHTYTTSGTRQISLRITDGLGRHEVANRTVHVGTRWPTASFTVTPSQGQPPLQVTFNPSATNHPNGLPLVYEWNLGDGTTFVRHDNSSFTHLYQSGNFTATLVVRDANGGFDAATRTISVANRAPVAVVDWDVGGGEVPLTVQFDGSASSDPDGDAITFLWNFQDGTTSTDPAPVHTFTTPGDYLVTLTVTDSFGASNTRSLPNPIRVRSAANPLPPVDPATLPDLLRGLEYSYYFNDVDSSTGRVPFFLTPDLITHLRTGVIDNFKTWNSNLTERYVYRYRGFIDIPEDGVYTFYVRSRNGILLNVAGQELLRDGGRWASPNAWNSITLAAGLHPIDFIYYANEASNGPFYPFLNFSWSGPGFAKSAVDQDRLYWRQGRPVADFVYSPAPGTLTSPMAFNFDAATSRAFDGDTIVDYSWEFPGGVFKNGRTVSHSFAGGSHRVILHVTTNAGVTASTAKTVVVKPVQNFELLGGVDRALMPGKIIRARGEFLPNGLASGAFDGDKTTRWLDLVLESWIEIEFRHNGQLQPYVINEYRMTSLTAWNERDPFSWDLYGSNDGQNWTLLHSVTGNSFSGNHPRTNTFPISNTNAYSFYRFANIKATSTSTAPDAVGLNLLELIDYGSQSFGFPPVASLNIANTTPAVGQIFSLDGSGSYDPEGYPLFYEWDFGDGQTQRGWALSSVAHTYHSAGSYTVRMTVTDALGGSTQATAQLVSAVEPNNDPVAAYTFLMSAPSGYSAVTFDASDSFDPDGDPITFHWEFGDGAIAQGPVVVHNYAVGKYTPLLIVQDDRGGRSTFAQELIIPPPAEPPLSIGINFAGRSNEFDDQLYPNEIAGLFPQANWNNMTSLDLPIHDSNGDPSYMAITVAGSGIARYGSNTSPRTSDHKLMRTGAGSVNGSFTFVNVPYASYDIYVYHSARRELLERDEALSIHVDTTAGRTTRFLLQADTVWNGQYAIGEATSREDAVQGENVIAFRGLTDRNFTIRGGSHQNRTLAHAIQIVDTSGGTILPPVNPPQVPQNFVAQSQSSSTIVLSWEPPAHGIVMGYRVERVPLGGSNWTQIAELTETTFNDTGLVHSTTYQYRVLAFNTGGVSERAGPVEATTLPLPTDAPETPDGLTATATSASSVFVQWNPTTIPADGYRLQRAVGDSEVWSQIADSPQDFFNDTGLLAGTTYRYRVQAYNVAGDSLWSTIATAQTFGEFGSGEEATVVSWGIGQYYNNADGSGDFISLGGSAGGQSTLNGLATNFSRRPLSAPALLPNYKQIAPPSPRFQMASVTFNAAGSTSGLTLFYRLDGRGDNSTVTFIQISTTTSSSAYGAHMIWWDKQDFLSGFDDSESAVDISRSHAVVTINVPFHILVRQGSQFYISQQFASSGPVNLSSLVWAPYNPSDSSPHAMFANPGESDSPASASALSYTPIALSNIDAIGVYVERISNNNFRNLSLREFRVITVLPETAPANNFNAWAQRSGFSQSELGNPAVSGPLADPDSSGVSNLMRHAFGMERGEATVGALPWIETMRNGNETQLTLHVRRSLSAEDVELTILLSHDLENWSPIGAEWSVSAASDPILDNIEWITAVSPALESPSAPVFLSVAIELLE